MRRYLITTSLLLLIHCCVSGQTIKGNYAIKNVETGMLLRIKDASNKNGTPLVAYPAQNWKCMTWNFISAEGNTYQLKNLLTGKTFQPKAGDDATETVLEEQALSPGNTTQQFDFEPAGKNIYWIKLKGTELYLTSGDKKGTINLPVILNRKNGTKEQQWSIYEQAPTM
ncbi:RICIN domain-containing protein [Pedobacter sp. HDW13]|uniref:RICIN domain-containing protein n=1 Tax=unclassified Pedobacter TaxID=2628915 RepID=UPI000F59E33D|nr:MULTISPECIES: RICIN domain-containing protein [unclassified Pedobacter]QIL41571.1 RICIN domain-containing protein [Pedobacter sp. HDW13]RQO78153.1 hypothetical protein DBR40_07750 [Pedobacter sp. KBW01]